MRPHLHHRAVVRVDGRVADKDVQPPVFRQGVLHEGCAVVGLADMAHNAAHFDAFRLQIAQFTRRKKRRTERGTWGPGNGGQGVKGGGGSICLS